VPQQYIEGELRIGNTVSYGAEFLIRKQSGRLNGWLSYTFMHTRRKIPEINEGKAFPPPYDKPHNISLFINYDITERIDAGITWVYSSAIPVTAPKSAYYYGKLLVPEYSERGGVRIPGTAYHRLDMSVNFRIPVFGLDGNLNVAVYNLYNRHNAFAVNFREKQQEENATQTGRSFEAVKLYLFPILPSLTFSVNF